MTHNPEIKYAANGVAYGNYTLAVDRPRKKDGDSETDFIYCKVLGKTAEFAEKHLTKGTKVATTGRIQVDNYTDKNGNKRSQTYVLVTGHEFCEARGNASAHPTSAYDQAPLPSRRLDDEFMNIPDGVDDEELPFN